MINVEFKNHYTLCVCVLSIMCVFVVCVVCCFFLDFFKGFLFIFLFKDIYHLHEVDSEVLFLCCVGIFRTCSSTRYLGQI